jgi:hypothetical protein
MQRDGEVARCVGITLQKVIEQDTKLVEESRAYLFLVLESEFELVELPYKRFRFPSGKAVIGEFGEFLDDETVIDGKLARELDERLGEFRGNGS